MEDTEKADSEPVPTNDDASPSQGKSCALCGCATPAVRCDRCNSQMFCLSCDDMYHRHPKRKLHLRKAVDSIWNTARSPRLRRRTELPGDPCKIPIPPPRSRKRERHTIGGRIFLKSGLELGSFGHSKVFDPKNLPTSKDFFTGTKSPASMVEANCDEDLSNPNIRSESGQIYENDNLTNPTGTLDGNLNDRSPWNPMRPNISSPIQVSIPSSSPDIVNGQSFGYAVKPHSQSAADLTGHTGHPVGHHPYHFHPPYPYMHPPMHPYSHSMAHLNCAQCLSSSWSNLISPHPSPYFHPMPWGSAQNAMARPPVPGQLGPMKHSHGDLTSYPDSSVHYPYPGGGYYHGGPPVVDPNFVKDLHEQAEMQKLKKDVASSRSNPDNEEMDTTTSPTPMDNEPTSASNAFTSTEAVASTVRDVQEVEEKPAIPEKPTEPWSCLHCTYINPPGIYICQVCCKTSYGNKSSEATEEKSEMRSRSRDSESPLINRDALLNSPDVSEFRDAQKDANVQMESRFFDIESKEQNIASEISEVIAKLTTETQTFTTTKTTDAQTQNVSCKSIASSTDSIFRRQEISVQTELETAAQNISVATDPMISSQSLESLLSGVSAPPYHNRRAGWGRGAASFSTQSLYERGRSRSPMPRSLSFHTDAQILGRDSSFASEEAVHSASQAWLYTDPMYYKPHNQGLGQALTKEDYFDGTWGSMDRLNRRVKQKKDKGKVESGRPKFHRSLDDLKSEKRPEIVHTQELLMLQTVKEAERCGFTLEDLHVAYLHCGKENPVYWLEDNWPSMIKNVIALAAKYGEDNEENDVGAITVTEAKDALRIHRGDIWDAVAECIENRQRKILELTVRGNFTQKQISEVLKHNEGNVELAYADLLRASTRRHKFILSPGLSTDSEDLNVYNPAEDGAVDHNVSVSPMKAAKLDVSAESKMEKKKSDFLTKLTAIREAQSERRKAREEKELIRETIVQDTPTVGESEMTVKEKDISVELTPSISREDSKEVEETVQDRVPESFAELEMESKPDLEVSDLNENINVKEVTEDSIPVDFDTNWSESQGEWIEEFSDEQWEEGDGEHWDSLGKKFQRMEKEFEEEAMQMAALWEKEELEDDVFEDETKVQQEDEVLADSDKKFDDWVKANLKVDSSEYEEDVETKAKTLDEDITNISMTERLELEGSQPSPLQHYPNMNDLSLKSQFESDWVDLPADAEIEKLAHDIVCEGSDIENKFDEAEMEMYEEEKKPRKFSDQGSDEDWEKIEMDEQLQEINELDHFAFPEKEGEIERNFEELDESVTDDKGIELTTEITSEIMIDKDTTVLYKNLENVSAADASDVGISVTDILPQTTDTRRKIPSVDEDLPKPPVRRKSKLSSDAIEQALKNRAMTEISSDIPPALPEKTRHKDAQQKSPDIYAMPDKTVKSQLEDNVLKESEIKDTPSVPQKPPRLNLSPLSHEESVLQKSSGKEEEPHVPLKVLLKEGSPVTPLSYESDSNFFADSESDPETKLQRQKNIHRKPAKYENEFEDAEMETISKEKLEEMELEENNDMIETNLDLELDEDIDPALIEPLPRMADIDFDPELPILLGGRGRQISEEDDVNAPKAFREDTTRPLQLFKATKRETPTSTLNMSSPIATEHSVEETHFIQRTSEGLPIPSGISSVPFEVPAKLPESPVYDNQASERYYYNEAIDPQQSLVETKLPDKQDIFDHLPPQEELMSQVGIEQEIEQAIQPIPAVQEDEVAFTEMECSSAAMDYFFGRYNEITVTRPKKKTSAKAKPPVAADSKSSVLPSSKIMSTSEVTSSSKIETPSQMEQSAAAILQEKPISESVPATTDVGVSNQQMQQIGKQAVSVIPTPKEEVHIPEKPKQPAPSECLSFAEDYLFGCYNQVVVPRKTRSKPVATIPKLGEASSLGRTQSPLKEQKQSTPIATPEPPELPPQEPEEEELEDEVPEDEESFIPTDASVIYDEVFHDFPSEMLSNQSFDESSIYYESFQDAVEDVRDAPPVDSSTVNVRSKTVHFVESEIPAAPPRKHKLQKTKAPIQAASSESSYADEYLYRQYELVPQAKKKLPVCSEDFRMKQGFEPTEIPCDIPLMPDEQEEGVISSEISVEIPSKSNESLKFSSEYEFGDSEQPLDSIEQNVIGTDEIKTTSNFAESQDAVPCSEDSSNFVATELEIISTDVKEDVVMSASIQSEKSESFEELSIPDQSVEVIKSTVVLDELNITEENKVVPDDLSSTVTESQFTNIHSTEPCDGQSYEPSVSSDRHEIDQYVFIDQTQDIIDDSYSLYDIQESLACDLNYVDVKGNIEDECTDDSEQEWKRNEDRKNTLNASFLNASVNKKFTDSQEESILDESEKSSLDDSKRHLAAMDELKTEGIQLEDEESTKTADEVRKFSEQSESIHIDDENITTEIVQDDKAVDVDLKQDSFTADDFQTISESGEEIKPEKRAESLSEIDQDFKQISTSINEFQIISESVSTEKAEEVQVISESISTETQEKIISEEIAGNPEVDQEGLELATEPHDIVTEELNVISSTSEADNLYVKGDYLESSVETEIDESAVTLEDLAISEDEARDVLEDFEISGELSDDNVSTHSSVSTQIAVSMKIGLKESEGDECSLNLEQTENLEYDNEVSVFISLPGAVILDKTQDSEDNIVEYTAESEDFEKLEDTSQKIFSKDEKYEYEAEYLEYEDEVDHKIHKAELTPTPSFENEPQTDRFSTEIDIEEPVSVIKVTLEDNIENGSVTCLKESLVSDENVPILDEELTELTEVTDRENFFEGAFDEDVVADANDRSEDVNVEKKDVLLIQDTVCVENSLSEVTAIDDDGTKLSGEQNDQIDSEPLIDEEPIIMTPFYDEWYQNVDPSAKFTLLSAESIYAKYGSAESSESGSESDVDNALSTGVSVEVTGEIKISKEESPADDVTLHDKFIEKDVQRFDYYENLSLEKDSTDEVKLYDSTHIYKKSDAESAQAPEVNSQVHQTHELFAESKLELLQHDQQISDSVTEESTVVKEKTEISSFVQERSESVSFYTESGEYVQSVKDHEISDTKYVKNKFSTSKSCQTEDSFEEDIFFDSFDDTFTIPSYLHFPIETQSKPPTSDISIQCELISNEDILSTKTILSSVSQTEVISSQAAVSVEDSPEKIKLRGEQPKQSELASEEKEESSCESFEDSDSDVFIESPSSQDELDVGASGSFLSAEVDSDTGFSSGSECGWTKKKDFKQKGLKKTSDVSVIEVHSQQTSSAALSTKKEIAGSVETYISKTSCDDTQSKTAETLEKSMAAENIEKEREKEYDEITPRNARASTLPSEIIERAITPVAIPQFPSFEDDLVFVEVQDNVEEVIDDNQEVEKEETVSSTPTVEYFYGPLPETIKIESPPDISERFFETASELSESLSFSADRTESFSDSISSKPLAEQIPSKLNIYTKSANEGIEDESFADTLSSLKGEVDDSISEYYPLPESSVSLSSRASLAESDISEFVESETAVDEAIKVAPEHVPSDDYIKHEKLLSEEFQTSTSEIIKSNTLTKIDESNDKLSQEIISVITSDNKEPVAFSKISTETRSKTELDNALHSEKGAECVSSEKMDISTELQETVSEVHASDGSVEIPKKEKPVESKSNLSADEFHISTSTEIEHAPSGLVKCSDIAPAPSDIVRYLYYDDSITFDDDSYHTQSENVDVPSLATDEAQPQPVDSTDIITDEKQMRILTDEVCTTSPIQSVSLTEEKLMYSSVSETVLSDELIQRSTEIINEEFQKISTMPKLDAPEVALLETDVKISEDDVIALAAEQTLEPEVCGPKNDLTPSKTDLKFPTVEVIASENIIVLPSATEEIHDPIIHMDEQILETVVASDVPSEDISTLEDSEFQDVAEQLELKQISSEIPHVPSDIVRYLYYDDDITFDDTTQSSFHSQSDDYIPDVGSEDLLPQIDIPEFSDIKSATVVESELLQEVESASFEVPQEAVIGSCVDVKRDSSDISHEESSYKRDSSSAKEESLPPFDSSECIENWFDLDEPNGRKKHLDSEQYSSTKSSALKDSEQPCIPEYILSPKLDGEPVGKTDIDEVTDISTHFTMTDDSDKFSDIESDTSLNFEEECMLPVEVEQDQDVEMFESYIEEDDMNVRTPEIKEMPGGFQFLIAEPLNEEVIEKATYEEFLEHEKFDECITSTEFSEHQSKEQFAECLTSSEHLDQQRSRKIAQEKEMKEKSDEFIISTDFSKVAEVQFVEYLQSELPDSEEVVEEHAEGLTEKFVECVTPPDFSEMSKEEFAECLTLSELSDQKPNEEASKEEMEEKFDECVDENGNFPELITKDSMPYSVDVKTRISPEELEISSQIERIESSSIDRDEEMNISCYVLPEEDSVSVEHSFAIAETENVNIPLENLEISSQMIAVKVEKDDDLESSCYVSPNEDSHSISTETTDNWSDAEGKNIEIDESVYDLPVEEMPSVQSMTYTETEKSEISVTEDSFGSFKFSEVKELYTSDETTESAAGKKDEICTPSEKDSKQPSVFLDNLLSSDSRHTSEVKMETEPEISTAMKKNVHIECMSAASGAEPTFSLGGTMCDIQEVQSAEISSKEVCLGEEVITSVLSEAHGGEDSSEIKITTNSVVESSQLAGGVDICESSASNIMETKYMEISNLETKHIKYSFVSEFIECDKAKISEIPPIIDEKDQMFVPTDKISDKKCEETELVDFKMVHEDIDFIGNKIEEQKVVETKEQVDFKNQFQTTEIRSKTEVDLTAKDVLERETVCGTLDSPEVVDFKGCIIADEDGKRFQVKETDAVEKSDSKPIEQKEFVYSTNDNILPERVDFKGEFIISDSTVSFRDEEVLGVSKSILIDKKCEETELVDFKILHEGIDFIGSKIDEQIVKNDVPSVVEHSSKFVITRDVDFSKVESDTTCEIVDFKGQLFADEVMMHQEKDKIQKDKSEKVKVKCEAIKVDQLAETVDFKGSICSNISESKKQEIESGISKTSVDVSQTFYSDNNAYDASVDDAQMAKIYKYDIADQSLTYDPREMYGYYIDEQAANYDLCESYGYNFDEQAASYDLHDTYEYNIDDQAITSELQQIDSEEMMMADCISYDVVSAVESSELYSCVETSSAAEDTSMQFYSVSDDLEDSLNVTTSEEFTDVPSHLTSTEGSDKWSDVEGDFSFEDAEFDRDKTPIRTDDIMISEKQEFKDATEDIEVNENKFMLKSVEDKSMIVLDSVKGTTVSSEELLSDLNIVTEKENLEDFKLDSQKLKTVSDLHEAKETEPRTYMLEEIKKTEAVSDLTGLDVLKHAKDTKKDVSDESMKETNVTEDVTKKIVEISSTSADKISFIQASSTISEKSETELTESSISKEISSDNYMLNTQSAEELRTSLDQELSSTDSAVLLPSTEEVESFSAEKSSDSLITPSEDYTDIDTHQFSIEESEKWSDVESEIEHLEKESTVYAGQENKHSIPKDVIDQVISDDSMKVLKEIQIASDDIDEPLTEHFADIKAIKDPLSTADTFSSLDAETAISKTHEDSSTDISSQFEKTESDHWLEAETEHSISEVGEDIAFCIEKDGDTKIVFVDYEKAVEEIDTALQSSDTPPYASTTSTSSSFSDLENSDQTSDTCADISLQGATTENSDKWSDIEAEGLIDDVLYGNFDITDSVELTEFPQLIKKPEETKDIIEIISPEDQLKIVESNLEPSAEISASSSVEVKSKSKDIKLTMESKSQLLKTSKSGSSFEGPDYVSSNLGESGQSSIPTESLSLLSTPQSAITTAGMSDDEFTNVTPLDAATEESDKWSDISNDTSVEEIDDESSVSLKASLGQQVQESDAVSNEFKVDLSRKVEESESTDVKFEVPKTENSVKNVGEESYVSLKADLKLQDKEPDTVSSEFKVGLSKKELGSTFTEDSEKFELKLNVSAENFIPEDATTAVSKKEDQSLQFHEQQDNMSSKLTIKAKNGKELSQVADSSTVKNKSNEVSSEHIEVSVAKDLSDENFVSFKTDFESKDQTSSKVSTEFKLGLSKDEPSSLITEDNDNRLKLESQIESESLPVKEIIKLKSYEIVHGKSEEKAESYIDEKVEIEDSSSTKITDESETLDNFTDVPTHTLTSETSDAYCELDSDHSIEEIESPQVEAEDNEVQDVQQISDIQNIQQTADITAQIISEYYENSLANEEQLEDEFVPDAIPENELENYEEEEYSLSEHFEINEDELIYPLPYNDDWIEQSFELKEYGVEAVFSETGSDIHGIGIACEEYDDEDIQRAIDYNLSTFEEDEGNVENIVTTESFKTLSNDASPHLKPEELDTWSTADAPSIEEEFEEQDNVLSKIDELLAEDFGDLDTYQTESPLKHDEDFDYLPRDISTPDETFDKDFIQIDNSSLPKDTLLLIDKSHEVTDSDIGSDEVVLKKGSAQIVKTESGTFSGKAIVKKDSIEVLEADCKTVSSIKKDSAPAFKTESETVTGEVMIQKKSATQVSKIESSTVSSDVTIVQDSTKTFKTMSVSGEIALKKDSERVIKSDYDDNALLLEATEKIKESEVSDVNEGSSSQMSMQTSLSKTFTEQAKMPTVTCDERKALRGDAKEFLTSSEAGTSIHLSSDELKKRLEVVEGEQTSSVEADVLFQLKSDNKSSVSIHHSEDFTSMSKDASSTVLSSSDSNKQIKDQLLDSATLSVSKTDSSFDIPPKKMAKSTEINEEFSFKAKTSTESSETAEFIQDSQHLSESSQHSVTSAAESIEVQSNIPRHTDGKDNLYSVSEQSVSLKHTLSKEQASVDSLSVEIKPDIPKKTKRRSLDTKEGTPLKDESDKKPFLPPKKSKRHSVSDSPSSSFGESLSSSSSVESLGSFESAVSDKSSKSSLKSSGEASMHSLSPEVPARRSRSTKLSSTSRSTSRDSEDSSSCSRSSSLKIRRRSSNFTEPEPIDLSKKRASIDERIRKLQNEGKCTTREKAFIAAKLIEMQFDEEDALLASRQCNTVYHAVKFLTQLCEMCNCRFPINLMSSMVHCAHKACKDCLKAHFTSLIYDRSVFTLLCPICHKPDITDQNIQEYFTHLDMTLTNILDEKVYDLFQRKLRDEVLTKDPNFHWCSQCSSGFIASPRLKKLYCPDCSAITCALCHQTWELEHEGVHCERFQQWKDMHTPEPPPAGTVKFLVDRGISCPSCGLVYDQACGGCLMYKCSHCSFEFCGFCSRPLKRGKDCSNEICDSRGLHIHHLHNCLFFIRDKDIMEIQMLLEEESVTYLTIPPKDQIVKSRCQVREQKIAHGALIEDRCGRDIEPYCGGLCRTHYYEYLAELLRMNNISPLSIMTIQDLQFMLRKSRILVPEKVKGEKSEDYYERLLNLVTRTLS